LNFRKKTSFGYGLTELQIPQHRQAQVVACNAFGHFLFDKKHSFEKCYLQREK
jgi:hypothetical protein